MYLSDTAPALARIDQRVLECEGVDQTDPARELTGHFVVAVVPGVHGHLTVYGVSHEQDVRIAFLFVVVETQLSNEELYTP